LFDALPVVVVLWSRLQPAASAAASATVTSIVLFIVQYLQDMSCRFASGVNPEKVQGR
jgi:hypothetical protein